MLALLLVGGIGKRLRPLTGDIPKPLLPLVNRTFLYYQFDMLKAHGIRDVLLCTSYRAADFKRVLGGGRRAGMRIRFVNEPTPLGTGGAIKNAWRLLRGRGTFLALNGDILMRLDVSAFLRFHRRSRAEVTIALAKVPDPTLYGLVKTGGDGRVRGFVEKPTRGEIDSDTINAGAYLFEPEVLDLMPPEEPYSLERRLFPKLLSSGERVFSFLHRGYWNDIGTKERYLQTHIDILSGRTPFEPSAGRTVNGGGGRALLGPGAKVEDGVRFSGHVCVGERCTIGRNAWLRDCVVLAGTRIPAGARLSGYIVSSRAKARAQDRP